MSTTWYTNFENLSFDLFRTRYINVTSLQKTKYVKNWSTNIFLLFESPLQYSDDWKLIDRKTTRFYIDLMILENVS